MDNKLLSSFTDYLLTCGFQKDSLTGYRCTITNLMSSHPNLTHFTYMDVVSYLEALTIEGRSRRYRQGKLSCLKKFFDFLVVTGKRCDHPCKQLQIQDKIRQPVIQSDLFSVEELQILLRQKTYFSFHETRNRIIFSLLISQALMPYEITRLKLRHIDLDKGTVFLPGSSILKARTLPLTALQIELLDHYIHRERSGLLLPGTESDFVIVCNKGGIHYSQDNIQYLIQTFKPHFPDRNLNARTIRDSVICHWVQKGIPIEQVQLMAGFRWISSAERYQHAPIEKQRAVLNRFFPLKAS